MLKISLFHRLASLADRHRWLTGTLVAFAAAVGIASVPSCSILYGGKYYQCEHDADCAAFEGTFCNENYVCQNNLEYCRTNSECIDRLGSETYICRDEAHRCVKLNTQACPTIQADPGDLREEDVIVLGAMGFPSIAPALEGAEKGLELARQDFKTTLGGVPPVTEGGRPRPVVVVSCDIDVESTTEYKDVADHLIDDLGVPVIFGPDTSDMLLYVVAKAIDNDVMIFSANNTGAALTDLPERKGILFRNYHAAEMIQRMRAKLIEQEVEARVRSELSLLPTDQIKMAVIHTGDGTQEVLISLFRDELHFNDGKSTAENGDNYQEFSYGDVFEPDYEATVAQVVNDVASYQPHITVYIGAAEIASVFVQVDEAYPDTQHHVLDPTAGTVELFKHVEVRGEDLRRRIWAVLGGKDLSEENFFNFSTRYKNEFKDGIQSFELFLASANYDQYYMTLYAIAAIDKRDFTGREVGEALFTRLGGSVPIEMGPGQIVPAFQRLGVGDNIVYSGAFTDSLFDEKGDIVPQGLVVCIHPDPDASFPVAETGLYYDPDTGELTGTNTCH
jgi:hypothetical protein